MDVESLRYDSPDLSAVLVELDWDSPGLRYYCRRLLGPHFEEVGGSANRRVPGKRHLGLRGENVDYDLVECRACRWEVHEDDLGEAELGCYSLLLRLREMRLGSRGHLDDGYRVPRVTRLRKDIERRESELHLGQGGGVEAVERIPARDRGTRRSRCI